jgi:ubiquinone/menaquinone biosynthesis C-methylase UbiE
MEAMSITEWPDEQRRHLHGLWSSVAPGWAEHADFVETRGAEVTARLLELTRPRPGEQVLELACGAGDSGIAAAALVGDDGRVVISDVAPEMTAIARGRADALGLRNVRTRELDLEAIDEPDESYDVVLCREGLMLVGDPGRATREIRRVLRPGGRAGIAVWGPREGNPWLGVVFDTVSAQLGTPMPPPGVPGPFSLDDPAILQALLDDAGLVDVEVDELPTPYHAENAEQWWRRTAALAGPLAQRLAALPSAAADALAARAKSAIAVYETSSGLDIPGLSLVAGAARS